MLREASHWASKQSARSVTDLHVRKAIETDLVACDAARLGAKIRLLRRQEGLSQVQLAEALGMAYEMAKAVTFIQEPENKPAVLRSLAKWLRLPRPEDAEAGYETIRNGYDRRLGATKEGLRNALRVLSKFDAKFSRLKVEDLVDERITKKLEKEMK